MFFVLVGKYAVAEQLAEFLSAQHVGSELTTLARTQRKNSLASLHHDAQLWLTPIAKRAMSKSNTKRKPLVNPHPNDSDPPQEPAQISSSSATSHAHHEQRRAARTGRSMGSISPTDEQTTGNETNSDNEALVWQVVSDRFDQAEDDFDDIAKRLRKIYERSNQVRDSEKDKLLHRIGSCLSDEVIAGVIKDLSKHHSLAPLCSAYREFLKQAPIDYPNHPMVLNVYGNLAALYTPIEQGDQQSKQGSYARKDTLECVCAFILCALKPEAHASDPSSIQPQATDNYALTTSRIRNSFATHFEGPAVLSLLTHIELLEHSITRYATTPNPSPDSTSHPTPLISAPTSPTRTPSTSQGAAAESKGPPRRSQRIAENPPQRSSATSPRRKTRKRLAGTALVGPPVTSTAEEAAPPRDTDYIYARVLPIIQSSGFGKSKLCVHLSCVQPGMLVCMRPLSAGIPDSFPPQDEAVFEYFRDYHESNFKLDPSKLSENDVRLMHATVTFFLAAYCSELYRMLSHLKEISGCFPKSSSMARTGDPHTPPRARQATASCSDAHPRAEQHIPAQCWATVVFSLASSLHKKEDFLSELVLDRPTTCPHSKLEDYLSEPESCAQTPDKALSSGTGKLKSAETLDLSDPRTTISQLKQAKARTQLLKRICDTAKANLDAYKTQIPYEGEKECVRQSLLPVVQRMNQLVPDLEAKPCFFLALDECNGFSKLLPCIRRVWKIARPTRFWILLLDTNSRIAPMIGPEADLASRRTAEHESRLAQPFVDMPLDVNLTGPKQAEVARGILHKRMSMRALNDLIPLFGRPLWNDLLYKDDDTIINAGAIVNKLVLPDTWTWPSHINNKDLDDTMSPVFQNIMALASQRIPLEQCLFPPEQPWQRFVRDQVSQHLRYMTDYFPATNVVATHVPSEPALSIAATWAFRSQPEEIEAKWSMVVRAMASAHSSMKLNVGMEGEEGVRLLCCLACDVASRQIKKNMGRIDETGRPYVDMMGVINLSDWFDSLFGSDIGSNSFRTWCRGQWLNFTHVADLAHQVEAAPSNLPQILGEFWLRHAAVRGVSNQTGWDLLIPVYASKTLPVLKTDIFDMQNLSYVAVQVKNWIKRPPLPNIIGPKLTPAPGRKASSVDIFLDLQGKPSRVDVKPSPHPGHAMHERYVIQASGLHADTFPVLSKLDGEALAKLPVVFGLPLEKAPSFRTDLIEYVRREPDGPPEFINAALMVKARKLNASMCIPSGGSQNTEADVQERPTKRAKTDSHIQSNEE